MTEADVIQYTTKALWLVLLLSMPPIIVASVVGVLVSLLQALTQIQEQTLAFAIKLIAITFTLYFTARWLGIEIFNYSVMVFDSIATLSGQ
jgi:type III secretion protein S